MKIIKLVITFIMCKLFHIQYHRGQWIHPSVRIRRNRDDVIQMGYGVVLHKGVRLDISGGVVKIGNGCSINTFSRIESGSMVELEDNVLIGPNVYISDRNHEYKDVNIPVMYQGYYSKGNIKIGEGTWIGIHAAIIGNVAIGKGCVIGANAVVTSDIPDYSVVVGNPGIVVKRYDDNSKRWERVSNHI